ncbi:MAG: efflux RND transporter periplasmic adaptor subunit [Haloferula sp.]
MKGTLLKIAGGGRFPGLGKTQMLSRDVARGIAVLVFGALAACSKSDEAAAGPAGPVEVTVHELEWRDFADELVAAGTLLADESTEISANVTERVQELGFDDGQRVEAGDLLALLESEEERGILEAAQASLDEEKRELKRLEPLLGRGVSEADVAARRTRLAVAQARIAQVQAQLSDRQITAPFAGRVGLRRISPGAMVEPSDVITTLDKTDVMKLDFTVPETFLSTLQPGLVIAARSSAFPERDFEGEVSEIDTRIDPVTRAVAVRALFPNPDDVLRPGMLMTVTLSSNPKRSLALPERAVVAVGEVKAVFRIEDGVARRVVIETGRRQPGWVEVVEGLAEGDSVVTDGVLSLRDGGEVKVAGTYEGAVEAYDPKSGQSS